MGSASALCQVYCRAPSHPFPGVGPLHGEDSGYSNICPIFPTPCPPGAPSTDFSYTATKILPHSRAKFYTTPHPSGKSRHEDNREASCSAGEISPNLQPCPEQSTWTHISSTCAGYVFCSTTGAVLVRDVRPAFPKPSISQEVIMIWTHPSFHSNFSAPTSVFLVPWLTVLLTLTQSGLFPTSVFGHLPFWWLIPLALWSSLYRSIQEN